MKKCTKTGEQISVYTWHSWQFSLVPKTVRMQMVSFDFFSPFKSWNNFSSYSMALSQLQGIFLSGQHPAKWCHTTQFSHSCADLHSMKTLQCSFSELFFNMLNMNVVFIGRKGKKISHSLCPARYPHKILTEKQRENMCKVHLLLLSKSQTLGRIVLGLISLLLKGQMPQNGRNACSVSHLCGLEQVILPHEPVSSFSKDDHTWPTLLTGLFWSSEERGCRTTLWSM